MLLYLSLALNSAPLAPEQVEWNLPDNLAVVSVKPVSRHPIPKDRKITAIWQGPVRPGSQPVRLHISGGRKLFAFATIRELVSVPVATRSIAEGEALSSDHFKVELRPVDPFSFSLDRVVGLKMLTAKAAGEAISQNDLALPPPIRRGTQVTVVAVRSRVRIKVPGTLITDSRIGSRAKVRIPSTRSVLTGRLVSESTVLLKEQPQ